MQDEKNAIGTVILAYLENADTPMAYVVEHVIKKGTTENIAEVGRVIFELLKSGKIVVSGVSINPYDNRDLDVHLRRSQDFKVKRKSGTAC